MLIAWTNLADTASLTAGSEIATLPGTNTQNAHLSRRWHTAAAVKNSYLIWDLGSSQSCACLGVFGTNLTSAATIRIRSSDLSSTVTANLELDTGTVSAGVVAGYGAIYKTFASTQSRYWRIDVEDTTVASNLQIGRVFLGPYWQPTYGHSYGWGVATLDPSRKVKSYGGQTHLDVRPQFRQLRFSLDWNNEAQMFANAFALARANGVVKDILVIPDPSGSYVSQQAVWGLVTESAPLINERVGIWRQQFSVEERL